MDDVITLAVSEDGPLVVVGDGPELLAWRGDDPQPLWRRAVDDRVVGVAIDARGLWALTRGGRLELRRPRDGATVQAAAALPDAGRCLVGRGDLVVAASRSMVVWMREGSREGEVDLPGVVAAALDGSVQRAALLDEAGSLTVVDLDAGTAVGRIGVGGRPGGVAWHPDGYWLVSAGGRVRPVRADAGVVEAPWPVSGDGPLAVAVGGLLLAVREGPATIRCLDLVSREPLGTVALGRDVAALAAQGEGILWVALAHGDVQRLDLLSGRHTAGRPHEGRAWQPWALDDGVDAGRVRGARARRRAAGGPLVAFTQPVRSDAPTPARRRVWPWLLGGSTLLLVLVLLAWWLL